MIRTLSALALVTSLSLVACGGGTTTPANAPAAAGRAPAADMPAEPAGDAAPREAADGANGDAPAKAATGPTQEELEKAKSLDSGETPFPAIDDVTKDIGPPARSGKGKRVTFWYDADTKSKHATCETLDFVRTPSGGAVLDDSVMTSPECKKIKATLAQVHDAFDEVAGAKGDRTGSLSVRADDLRGKTYDAVVAIFEKKLGKPQATGEPDFGAWTYVLHQSHTVEDLGADQACRMVLVTSHLLSGAGQAIWGVPCE